MPVCELRPGLTIVTPFDTAYIIIHLLRQQAAHIEYRYKNRDTLHTLTAPKQQNMTTKSTSVTTMQQAHSTNQKRSQP